MRRASPCCDKKVSAAFADHSQNAESNSFRWKIFKPPEKGVGLD